MSAAVLREAAAKMRERAEAATGSPWQAILIEDEDGSSDSYVISLTGLTSIGEDVGEGMCGQDAEHIASWHPAVALAVADWLDDEAEWIDAGSTADGNPALAVARAYLGADS